MAVGDDLMSGVTPAMTTMLDMVKQYANTDMRPGGARGGPPAARGAMTAHQGAALVGGLNAVAGAAESQERTKQAGIGVAPHMMEQARLNKPIGQGGAKELGGLLGLIQKMSSMFGGGGGFGNMLGMPGGMSSNLPGTNPMGSSLLDRTKNTATPSATGFTLNPAWQKDYDMFMSK